MITINITYFNEPHWLKRWNEFNQKLIDAGVNVNIAICDDGSDRLPASEFFEKNKPANNITLYRVKKNIGFNSHGCRNLLMRETYTAWNVLTDIDRSYTIGTIQRLSEPDALIPGRYYAFWDYKKKRWSLNDYVIHKRDFWEGGGYDEVFTNTHWGDRIMFEEFLDRKFKRIQDKKYMFSMDRGARNVSVENIELTDYPDDNTLLVPANHWWRKKSAREKVIQEVKERYRNPTARKSKPVIQFDWERVF